MSFSGFTGFCFLCACMCELAYNLLLHAISTITEKSQLTAENNSLQLEFVKELQGVHNQFIKSKNVQIKIN